MLYADWFVPNRQPTRHHVAYTDLPTLKYFCQYSQQPVSVFSDCDRIVLLCVCVCVCVCGWTTNQSNQKSVKGQFFYHSSCKNSVWTPIFNLYRCTTKLAHYDTRTLLFWLHLLKSFWIKGRRKFYPKAMHCVLLLLMPKCLFLNSCLFFGLLHSSSSSSASCSHLSPTASNSACHISEDG